MTMLTSFDFEAKQPRVNIAHMSEEVKRGEGRGVPSLRATPPRPKKN